MAEFGFTLDISHMDEQATLQALDFYPGTIIATHANVKALLPETQSNRFLSDRVIKGVVERNGIIVITPFNSFLKDDWKKTDAKSDVSIDSVVNHIDYICQVAGKSNHVGIGSDFDGGFGYNLPQPKSIASLIYRKSSPCSKIKVIRRKTSRKLWVVLGIISRK
jgi:membrane dipeptidase